jgi:HEAT repeat protein/class 3 adenylate cyclase
MSQVILNQIKSNDETLWQEGLKALVKAHTSESLDLVVSLLSDISWHKREAAAKELEKWGGDTIVATLAGYLDENNVDQLYWILKVLGNIGTEQCVVLIKPFLTLKNSELRGYAVRALGSKRSLTNARALYPMLNDINWAVRKLTFEQLLSFGDLILDDLRKIITASVATTNHSVVALFLKIGKEQALPELLNYYANGTFTLRHAILSSVAELETVSAIDFLIKGLADESWALRLVAAEQLNKLGPKAFDRLTSAYSKADSVVRYEIIKILVNLLGEKSLPLLNRLLSAQDQENRMLAVSNLSRLKSDTAIDALVNCLSDPDRIVSDYAAECIIEKSNINIDFLVKKLNSNDENLRFQIIKIIGSIGGLALAPIVKILEHGNKQEKLFLLGVLQKVAPCDTLIEALIALLKDPQWPIRNAAANCLVRYEDASVKAVVIALNDVSSDVRFWSEKILAQIGPKAIKILTDLLVTGTDINLMPHIVSALLSTDQADAIPAVTKFIENNDDYRLESIFNSAPPISSKDVVNTILNLLSHPDERVATWLSKLLHKISSSSAQRTVFLGLSHSSDRVRLYVANIISTWELLNENDVRMISRQLSVEKSSKNLIAIVRIIAKHPYPAALDTLKGALLNYENSLMLELILEAVKQGHPNCLRMVDDFINTNSEAITQGDVEKIGVILSYLYKDTPDGLVKGLTSPSKAYRMCCIIALDSIKDRKTAFGIMDNLLVDEDPEIMFRAVKTLAPYLFHDDFRLKGAVTEFFLSLNKFIVAPLTEAIDQFENEIDRKAIVDLIESVGGTVDPAILKQKTQEKVILSDSHLDEVLEKRRQALEELEKYDELIKVSHTMNLTIMFTDVKGFTAFSAKASLSEVMSMLKQHDEILQPVFKKYEGEALKKIGDAFLVVFENHNNAILAAIEIQKQLKAFNETVPEERKLAIRIAINTGSVIRTENDVMGDAVNLASRIEGVADAFEIVISEFTLSHIDAAVFNLSDNGAHEFKGMPRPIATYKVNW